MKIPHIFAAGTCDAVDDGAEYVGRLDHLLEYVGLCGWYGTVPVTLLTTVRSMLGGLIISLSMLASVAGMVPVPVTLLTTVREYVGRLDHLLEYVGLCSWYGTGTGTCDAVDDSAEYVGWLDHLLQNVGLCSWYGTGYRYL